MGLALEVGMAVEIVEQLAQVRSELQSRRLRRGEGPLGPLLLLKVEVAS